MKILFANFIKFIVITFTLLCVSLFTHAAKKNAVNHKISVHAAPSAIMSEGRDVDSLYVVILTEPSLVAHKKAQQTNSLVAHPNNQAVEKIDLNDIKNQAYIRQLDRKQKQILTRLSSSTALSSPPKKAEMSFQIAANAFTTRLQKSDIDTLKSMPGVKTIQKITPHQLMTDLGPSHIQATTVWLDNGSRNGYQGEGIIVGIIDTGINAQHPSFAALGADGYQHTNPLGNGLYLGDCAKEAYAQYCNDKLIGIWSHPQITNNSATPEIGLDGQGHGTHVASTVAGNIVKNVPVYNVIGDISNTRFAQISGVAPHANIVSYQVCDFDGCWPDITVQAVEHAITNGIDVINYSIGGAAISPWDSIDALAMLSARETGIHVAVSAGNNGPTSNSVASPGNAPWLTSVAAISHGRSFTNKTLTFDGGASQLDNMIGFSTTKGISADIIDGASLGNGDCLRPFENNSLTNKVVVCRRGDIPRVEKGRNALAGDAAGMILVNTPSGNQSLNTDFHILPAAHISSSDGDQLIAWLNDGNTDHQVNFNDSEMSNDLERADFVADFSSRGPEPIYQGYLVPHVAAPGVNIYAANAVDQPYYSAAKQPKYEFLDGTSMASPHAAGALALIAGLRPNWSPAQAQSALMLTASTNNRLLNGQEASFYDSGAGTINVDDAINASLTMDESAANYKQADPKSGGNISNLNLPALVDTNCMLECSWQRNFTASKAGSFSVTSVHNDDGINITASPSSFNLNEGEQITLEIDAEITSSYNTGLVSGQILIETDNDKSSVSLPLISSFKKGKHPENIVIQANTNKGSAVIEGVFTVAVSTLTSSPYGLSEIEQVTVNLPRDDTDRSTFPYSVFNDPLPLHSQSITINPGTRYLEVSILNTQSPDLDLYIGIDWNFNGVPDSVYEMNDLLCESATSSAIEQCIIESPPAGNYFIAIHNFGNPQAPSGAIDSVIFEVITIAPNDSSITTSFNQQIVDEEDINLVINWDAPLTKNSEYMTAIDLGSGLNTANDVAFIPVRLVRSNKNISTSFNKAKIDLGDEVTLSIFIDPNDSQTSKQFDFSLPLPKGLTVVSANVDYQILDGNLHWNNSQMSADSGVAFHVTFTTASMQQARQLKLLLSVKINGQQSDDIAIRRLFVLGTPTALINGSDKLTMTVDEGESFILSALESINPNVDSELTFQWQQTLGPALSFTQTDAEINIIAPQVNVDSQAQIELVVSSNNKQSIAATVLINITDKPTAAASPPSNKSDSGGGGGGAWSMQLLWLMFFLLLTRIGRTYTSCCFNRPKFN